MTTRYGVTGHNDEFASAREFVDFLMSSRFQTSDVHRAAQTGTAGWIFRGQMNSEWKLFPSAFRKDPPPDWLDFTSQTMGDSAHDKPSARNLGWHLHLELSVVFRFLEAADRLGIRTPINYATRSDGYDEINNLLSDEVDVPEAFPPTSFQGAVALAQHHGVPTRLLDWSESPLTASFFAANGARTSKGHPKDRADIGVFYLRVENFGRESSPLELIHAPRHESNYLLKQLGLFTNIVGANAFYLETGEWPCIEDALSGSPKTQLHVARLPGVFAEDLLRILYDLGITPARLMPSLDNVARSFQYVRALFGSRA